MQRDKWVSQNPSEGLPNAVDVIGFNGNFTGERFSHRKLSPQMFVRINEIKGSHLLAPNTDSVGGVEERQDQYLPHERHNSRLPPILSF